MPTPLLATPAADSNATCAECGETLVRTGKPATFSEGKMRKEYRGWVPALLVTVCPKCDTRADGVEPTVEPTPEPTAAVAAEGYLERLGREADEAAMRKADEHET